MAIASHRRRWRILLPGFQPRYVAEHVAFLFLIWLALSAAVFGPLIVELQGRDAADAATKFLWLHAWFWPVTAVAMAVKALHAVWLSHRIAGPLYRFRRVFDQLARGDLSGRVRIRPRDYLIDEAHALDVAVSSLRERAEGVRAGVAALASLCPRLESLSHDDRLALERAVSRLDEAAAAFSVVPVAAPTAGAVSLGERGARAASPSASGFSLIELLVVVALIGVLSAIAIPGYAGVLEKARVTRAVGDIHAIQTDIQLYQMSNGFYPATLLDARPTPTFDPWGRAYVYTDLGSINGKGKARKDHSLNPLNADFDLYSVGKDGKSSTPLTAKASHDDIVRANDGAFIGLASDY